MPQHEAEARVSRGSRYVRCNVCARDDASFYFEENGFNVVRCKHCASVYVNPQPTKEEHTTLYNPENPEFASQEYYSRGFIDDSQAYWIRARRDIKAISEFKSEGRLLDVGCGPGFFVKVAQDNMWDAAGMELRGELVRYTKENLGVSLLQVDFDEADFNDEWFDVVALINVLSHLGDPRSTLLKVNRILKQGGLLFLRTGNLADVRSKRDAEILGQGSWGVPDHLWWFGQETLATLIRETGFEMVHIESQDPVDRLLSPESLAVHGNSGWKLIVKTLFLRPPLLRWLAKVMLKLLFLSRKTPHLSLTVYCLKRTTV